MFVPSTNYSALMTMHIPVVLINKVKEEITTDNEGGAPRVELQLNIDHFGGIFKAVPKSFMMSISYGTVKGGIWLCSM